MVGFMVKKKISFSLTDRTLVVCKCRKVAELSQNNYKINYKITNKIDCP